VSNPESERDPSPCWKCPEAEVIKTSTGEMYVICSPTRWKGAACLTKLLATIRKPAAMLEKWMPTSRKGKRS